jgi:hypothetical protein
LISKSKAITSDDGTGRVFCSNASDSVCCVVMTAINKQTDALSRGDGDRTRTTANQAQADKNLRGWGTPRAMRHQRCVHKVRRSNG